MKAIIIALFIIWACTIYPIMPLSADHTIDISAHPDQILKIKNTIERIPDINRYVSAIAVLNETELKKKCRSNDVAGCYRVATKEIFMINIHNSSYRNCAHLFDMILFHELGHAVSSSKFDMREKSANIFMQKYTGYQAPVCYHQ